jgi:parallel beta-helix repeat protein
MSDSLTAALIARVQELERRLSSLESSEYTGQASSLKPWFDVKRYGATGDGTTDDRAAIVAAVAACGAAGGGVVHIPSGTYSVDTDSYADAISLPDNCHVLMAPDAVIQLAALDAGDDAHAIFRINGADNVHVSGGTIIGQRTGPSSGEHGFGIYVSGGSTNVLIENVEIIDQWGDAIYIGGTQNSNITVRNCLIDNCRRNGISVTNGIHVLIAANTFSNINGTDPQVGIDLEPNADQSVEDVRIIANQFRDCVNGGLSINGQNATNQTVQHVVIEGNFFHCPDTMGIALLGPGTSDCIANGNYIRNTTYAFYIDNYPVRLNIIGNYIYSCYNGLYGSGLQASIIANNNIYSPGHDGIRIFTESGPPAQYPRYLQISGNIIYNPGRYGISLIDGQYCVVSNNIIRSSVDHGIYLHSAASANNIIGNVLIACGSAGSKAAIYLSLADNCQLTDNIIRAAGVTTNGIVIGAGADNNIARNNDIFDLAAAAAVVDSGTGTVTTSSNRTA